jgi:hypothetical protein
MTVPDGFTDSISYVDDLSVTFRMNLEGHEILSPLIAILLSRNRLDL